MTDSHLNRLLRETAGADVFEALTERLSPTDLQSLLLEVYRRRAAQLTPAQVLDRYRNDRFAAIAVADPRDMQMIEAAAFQAAPGFTPVELSPVCPLGAVSVLGTVSQDKVVATARNTEVVADSTNVMALECAVRRAAGEPVVRLCCSHRLLRPQPLLDANSYPHFKVFAMCTAGRDVGNHEFEIEALISHLSAYLRLLQTLQDGGYRIKGVRLLLTDLADHQARLEEKVLPMLAASFPAVTLGFDPGRTSGRGYYGGVSFNILVTDENGEELSIADGGFTDWTRKLLQSQKERLLISGMGTERLCMLFAPRHGAG
jgi:hypothetical protein